MIVWAFSGTGALEAVGASAARALLAACVVGAGLSVLRVRNVAAQKIAWTLVLSGALLMPLLSPWVAQQAWMPHWLPDVHSILASMKQRTQTAAAPAEPEMQPVQTQATRNTPASIRESTPAWRIRQSQTAATAVPQPAPDTGAALYGPQLPTRAMETIAPPLRTSLVDTACAIYLVIVAALLLRLFYGLGAAMRLWRNSVPANSFATEIPIRMHSEIPSPVTIGSGILLPADHTGWGAEKLRVVLAHEGSHVRQGDFYLQLAAGIYAAIFWFSPLGWWLKHKLSDLGEAIGDRAAVAEAASRASYARLLLEFAEQSRDGWTRTTQFGVAMARTGRISHRIERLLNEQRFTQAFTGSRARLIGSAALAALAIVTASALVHAQATSSVQQPASAQATGTSHPDTAPVTVPANAAPAPVQSPAPAPAPAAPAPSAVSPAPSPSASPESSPDSSQSSSDAATNANIDAEESHTAHVHNHSSAYSYSDDGSSYAIINGHGRPMNSHAQALPHGSYLWFTKNGKEYVVDDPAVIARLQAMTSSMDALGAQQKACGRQQAEFGRQQAELAQQLAQMRVNQPDFQKQMADLSAQIARMKIDVKIPQIDTKQLEDLKQQMAALQLNRPDFDKKMAEMNAQIAKLTIPKISALDQQRMAELNEKMAETSQKIAAAAAKAAAQDGKFSELQSRLGAQQGKLGAIQGRLGAQQGRLSQELNRKVQEIIQQSLQNGAARPVQ